MKRFPILPTKLDGGRILEHEPIPWEVAERAYIHYQARWKSLVKDRTLEVIVEECGGWSYAEMNFYLPNWREMSAKIDQKPFRENDPKFLFQKELEAFEATTNHE